MNRNVQEFNTRISKKLDFWRKLFQKNARHIIGNIWPFSVGIASVAFIIALEISIFGYFPGVENPDAIFTICWSFLGLSLIFIQASYISCFASDIENRQIENKLIHSIKNNPPQLEVTICDLKIVNSL